MKRTRLAIAACVCAIGVAACSHSQTVAATPSDRAACAQAGVAYSAFNAWNGGPRPTTAYRRAISVAGHAHNATLSDAISDWLTGVLDPAAARPGPDAAYTMEECRQIGVPLQFATPRPNGPTAPSSPSSPSTGDSEGSGGDD
jgi:hypothetical protein